MSPQDLAEADALAASLRASLQQLSRGDPRALAALHRRVLVRLRQDSCEMSPRKLQVAKYAEQGGLCDLCGLPMSRAGAHLQRRHQNAGLTIENTRLVHDGCGAADSEDPDAPFQR